MTPNEAAYGFRPSQALDLTVQKRRLFTASAARVEVADAIAFANMAYKRHYDRKHQPQYLRVGDWALLRLHRGYEIPSTTLLGPKLSQQYAGPFKVIERIGRLAYRLELPDHWHIHPVFTIAQLEPAPPPNADPFDRPRPDEPDSVFVEGDTEDFKSFEVERLINKRIITKGRGVSTQYLVRWKGYGPQYDQWMSVKQLDNATDRVDEYERHAESIKEGPSTPSTSKALVKYKEPGPPAKRGRGRPRKT